MRIATFNVENLFSRAAALNLASWAEGKIILDQVQRATALLQNAVYTADDKAAIADALTKLGLLKSDESKFVVLRRNRGKLLSRSGGKLQVVAAGRGDWLGWLELKTEAVNEIATRMTARVVADLNADVLAVVEAENRDALRKFNDQLLGSAFNSIMLIDGNDPRGIDVGLMAKSGFAIESMVSHVDDPSGRGRVFSRDCPEFSLRTPSGKKLLVLVNHLKSKGFGSAKSSDARRLEQATRVREIYDLRRKQDVKYIAVVGDFNDTPSSAPLAPLMSSDLRDISAHPKFQSDGRPGTYANGTASNKIDYILFSPELFKKVTAAGIERRGVWGGVNGTLFPHYPEIENESKAASDHAALWADVKI